MVLLTLVMNNSQSAVLIELGAELASHLRLLERYEAQGKTWMYRESLWEIQGWLELLPFSDRPAATIEGVELVLSSLPSPAGHGGVVSALSEAPGEDAEADPRRADAATSSPRIAA